MGAELCLAHDRGGGGIWGAPFGRHAALWLFHLYLAQWPGSHQNGEKLV